MAEKRLVELGRYADPEDTRKPYWVKVQWFDNYPPVQQPLTDGEFWLLLGRVFGRYGPIIMDVGTIPS